MVEERFTDAEFLDKTMECASMLRKPEPDKKYSGLAAIEILGTSADTDEKRKIVKEHVIPHVGKLLESDEVPFVRARVAEALKKIGHPAALHYLPKGLTDADESVRQNSLGCLNALITAAGGLNAGKAAGDAKALLVVKHHAKPGDTRKVLAKIVSAALRGMITMDRPSEKFVELLRTLHGKKQ